MGTPCNNGDRDLFTTDTKVMLGNGTKAKFWESSCLEGQRPKDIAPFFQDIRHHLFASGKGMSNGIPQIGLTIRLGTQIREMAIKPYPSNIRHGIFFICPEHSK